MADHRDIPDEVVKRAQQYDLASRPPMGPTWNRVPDDQVRRLLWGAYGGMPAVTRHDGHAWAITEVGPAEPLVFSEGELAIIAAYEDGSED